MESNKNYTFKYDGYEVRLYDGFDEHDIQLIEDRGVLGYLLVSSGDNKYEFEFYDQNRFVQELERYTDVDFYTNNAKNTIILKKLTLKNILNTLSHIYTLNQFKSFFPAIKNINLNDRPKDVVV